MENEKDQSKASLIKLTGNGLFDGAAWIAICSAFGYHLVYVYERAYCGHFHIPTEFIKVSLPKLSYAFSALLSSWFFSLFLMDATQPLTKQVKLPPKLQARFKGIDTGGCIYIIIGAALFYWAFGNWYILALFAFWLALEVFFGLLRGQDLISSESFSIRVYRKLGRKTSLIIFVLFITTIVSGLVGSGIARHKKDFISLKGHGPFGSGHEVVCVAEYNGVLICAEVDSLNNIIPIYRAVDYRTLSADFAVSLQKIHIDDIKVDTTQIK